MAKGFTSASSMYIYGAAPNMTLPISMFARFRSTTLTASQTILSVCDSNVNNAVHEMEAAGATTGDPIRATTRDGTTSAGVSATGYSADTWHNAAVVFASSTSRKAGIDGTFGTANTDSRSPTTTTPTIGIAARAQSTVTGYLDGAIDYCAIWFGYALTDADFAALNLGFSPVLFAPNYLVSGFFTDLQGTTRDWFGAVSFTEVNSPSSYSDSGLLIYPSRAKVAELVSSSSAPAIYSGQRRRYG